MHIEVTKHLLNELLEEQKVAIKLRSLFVDQQEKVLKLVSSYSAKLVNSGVKVTEEQFEKYEDAQDLFTELVVEHLPALNEQLTELLRLTAENSKLDFNK